MELHLLILIGLFILPALIAAFAVDMLKSAIALLFCSVGLTLLLFTLGAPLAAVFELSVCSGLIIVLFINTISLSRLITEEERTERAKDHYRRFMFLPLLVLLIAALLWFAKDTWTQNLPLVQSQETQTVGEILWRSRGLDLIGQIIIMLVGVYGVVVLFKRGKSNA